MKAADIINQAMRKTGLGPFEGASYHEGLDVLVENINACEAATAGGDVKAQPRCGAASLGIR